MGRHKAHHKPQVFDVSKPGRTAPSPTSRPIIINQRGISDDPMVSGGEGEKENLMTHGAKSVVPVTVEDQPSSENIADHNAEPDQSTHPTETAQPDSADAFNFGSYPEQAEPQKTEPPPQEDQAPAIEPPPSPTSEISIDANGEMVHGQPAGNPPAGDTHSESENPVLPAELTSPEADDPVALSGVITPAGTQQPDESTHLPSGSASEQVGQAGENAETVATEIKKDDNQEPTVPENIGEIEKLPPVDNHYYGHYVEEGGKGRWLLPLLVLLLAGFYIVLDTGLVGSGKLPFEIFKQSSSDETSEAAPVAAQPASPTGQPSQPAPTTPLGFTSYSLDATPLSFAYPTVWGQPTVAKDEGFSKRGGSNKSDGVHAYIISFAGNKDVELALTSSKYLPPQRPPAYYDFLQWCTGTHDGKIYRQKLLYATEQKVDTPTTITCSDGPVEATKIDDNTVLQQKLSGIGDIYSKNLFDKEFVVIRAKDATGDNAENIKQLLNGAKIDGQSSSAN